MRANGKILLTTEEWFKGKTMNLKCKKEECEGWLTLTGFGASVRKDQSIWCTFHLRCVNCNEVHRGTWGTGEEEEFEFRSATKIAFGDFTDAPWRDEIEYHFP